MKFLLLLIDLWFSNHLNNIWHFLKTHGGSVINVTVLESKGQSSVQRDS
jgi:hypothetical protein